MLFRTQFSWEHLCYITHFANFCKDTNALLEMFNSQFDTDRTLGSIELFLKKCEMEDFIILSQYADHYNWYNEHPARPGHPLIFLGSQTMRTELRAYLAYHHDRGMDFSTLKEHFNQTFATEARSSGQLKQQVNLLKNDNYLLNCLRNFSPRYPWHPKYKETLEYNETIKRKEALKKRTEAAHYADSKSAAKARLVAAKKTSKKHGSDPAAQAEQNRLLGWVPLSHISVIWF